MGLGGLLENEEEEENRLFIELYKSDKACTACNETLLYTDEVFVLTVAAVQVFEAGVLFPPLLTADGMDFLYAPHFLCFNCYENAAEDLASECVDTPPIEDVYAVLECTYCGSGVRDMETVGVACFGELHLSHKQPNGEAGASKFAAMDPDPGVLCIACLNHLSGDVLDPLWGEQMIQQFNECLEGMYARCWRYGCSAQGNCGSCQETI